MIVVDDSGFTLEPPRWPEAYARSVMVQGAPPPDAPKIPVMRLSAAQLPLVLAGAGDAAAILADGAASKPLPVFDIPARLSARFKLSRHEYTSDNVLGLLPGTDPALGPAGGRRLGASGRIRLGRAGGGGRALQWRVRRCGSMWRR